jgi:hypothetical protein
MSIDSGKAKEASSQGMGGASLPTSSFDRRMFVLHKAVTPFLPFDDAFSGTGTDHGTRVAYPVPPEC